MAMITYPLNNIEYTAEDAELFHCTRKSGVYATNSFILNASGTNTQISVGKGIAWISNGEFSGKVVAQRETNYVDLGAADSTYPRIDVIAIQYNANDNATKLIVKKGRPSSNPQMPSITRTSSVYELYLCKVLRPAGSAVVKTSEITALRTNENLCGLMADSITSISTEDIDDQIQALIKELNDEIKAVKNQTDVLLKSGLYPVGSVFMTARNESPASYLGGEWSLFDKDFAGLATTYTNAFEASREVESASVTIVRSGQRIRTRIEITLAMDLSPEDGIVLGYLDFEKLGIGNFPYSLYNIPQGFDVRDCVFFVNLSNAGALSITDSVHKSITTDILFEAGDKLYIEISLDLTYAYMLDSACNKFYWKRTA